MGKIILDRSGDLRSGVFYQFHVPMDDGAFGLRAQRDWIVVPRTPTNAEVEAKGEEPYLYISPWTDEEDLVETKDCPTDVNHVTHSYSRKMSGDAFGGKRVSPFIPMNIPDEFAVSDDFHRRIEKLELRGARMDGLDLRINPTEEKLRGFWSLQFIGKVALRNPKLVEVANTCPYCGQGKILCESCGDWNPSCKSCRKEMTVLETKHGGQDDKRVPLEYDPRRVIEGNTWDGSDLLQAFRGTRAYCSKRFIDWLLRIHAAPFFAEPVFFCVDGMSQQQQRWFKELERPLET